MLFLWYKKNKRRRQVADNGGYHKNRGGFQKSVVARVWKSTLKSGFFTDKNTNWLFSLKMGLLHTYRQQLQTLKGLQCFLAPLCSLSLVKGAVFSSGASSWQKAPQQASALKSPDEKAWMPGSMERNRTAIANMRVTDFMNRWQRKENWVIWLNFNQFKIFSGPKSCLHWPHAIALHGGQMCNND